MGRPAKKPEQQRRHVITYRVTDDELVRLEKRAGKAGAVSVNDFARRAALSGRITATKSMTFPFDVARELKSIGVNINQQTRRLHVTGQASPELKQLWAKLDGLLSLMVSHGSTHR